MGKIKIDGDLWKALWQTAVRLTGYKTPEETKKDEPPAVPQSRKEAEELEQGTEKHSRRYRDQLLVYDNSTYLWICDHVREEQEIIIDFLCRKGIIKDIDKVRRQISDWYKHGKPGLNAPTEATPMSDDVLDRWTQYLHMNRNLFDDPEQFSEEYIH